LSSHLLLTWVIHNLLPRPPSHTCYTYQWHNEIPQEEHSTLLQAVHWDSGDAFFVSSAGYNHCDCGSCYSRRTAMINLLMRQIALRRWCSRRIPAFDRLGGGSRRCFCHGYFVSFAVTLLLQKLQKASDFCNNFCNLRLQNGPDTPVLSNISQDFRWYVVMVFSSYEFLCSFCNNGCKTDVTSPYAQYLQQFLQPRLSYRHTHVKKRRRQKHRTSAPWKPLFS